MGVLMIMPEVNGATIKGTPFTSILVLEDLGVSTGLDIPVYDMPDGHDLRSASKARQVFWIQMFTIQAERLSWRKE